MKTLEQKIEDLIKDVIDWITHPLDTYVFNPVKRNFDRGDLKQVWKTLQDKGIIVDKVSPSIFTETTYILKYPKVEW